MRKGYKFLIIILLVSKVGISQWMWQNPKPHGYTLWGLYFLNQRTGWACGMYGVVQKTTNGGLTYSYQQIDSVQLTSVYFLNEMTGYIGGGVGRLYRTTDGGNTYTLIRNGPNEIIYRLVFTDGINGWAWGGTATNTGFILHTGDGGWNWQIQYSNSYGEVASLSFLNSGTGYGCLYPGGAIIKTTNGGQNWVTICDSTINSPHIICFLNETTGIMGSYYTAEVMKTTNGGYNWYHIYNTFFQNYIDDIGFVNETTGFLSTGPYFLSTSYILKSTDAGENWFVSLVSTEAGEFYPSLTVKLAPIIRAVGDFGTSVVSYDNGN
ncbi:MAG: WD40/YVTN/BNR-like repeat-containing protein, partial [Ignavibacteria bacterium]